MPRISFSQDVAVHDITRHDRSLLEDLFYFDEEIAEFRHDAFLVECGLKHDDHDDHEEDYKSLDNSIHSMQDLLIASPGTVAETVETETVSTLHSSLPVLAMEVEDAHNKLQQHHHQSSPISLSSHLQATSPRLGSQRKKGSSPKSSSSTGGSSNNRHNKKFQALIQRSQQTAASSASAPPPPRASSSSSIQDRIQLWNQRDDQQKQQQHSSVTTTTTTTTATTSPPAPASVSAAKARQWLKEELFSSNKNNHTSTPTTTPTSATTSTTTTTSTASVRSLVDQALAHVSQPPLSSRMDDDEEEEDDDEEESLISRETSSMRMTTKQPVATTAATPKSVVELFPPAQAATVATTKPLPFSATIQDDDDEDETLVSELLLLEKDDLPKNKKKNKTNTTATPTQEGTPPPRFDSAVVLAKAQEFDEEASDDKQKVQKFIRKIYKDCQKSNGKGDEHAAAVHQQAAPVPRRERPILGGGSRFLRAKSSRKLLQNKHKGTATPSSAASVSSEEESLATTLVPATSFLLKQSNARLSSPKSSTDRKKVPSKASQEQEAEAQANAAEMTTTVAPTLPKDLLPKSTTKVSQPSPSKEEESLRSPLSSSSSSSKKKKSVSVADSSSSISIPPPPLENEEESSVLSLSSPKTPSTKKKKTKSTKMQPPHEQESQQQLKSPSSSSSSSKKIKSPSARTSRKSLDPSKLRPKDVLSTTTTKTNENEESSTTVEEKEKPRSKSTQTSSSSAVLPGYHCPLEGSATSPKLKTKKTKKKNLKPNRVVSADAALEVPSSERSLVSTTSTLKSKKPKKTRAQSAMQFNVTDGTTTTLPVSHPHDDHDDQVPLKDPQMESSSNSLQMEDLLLKKSPTSSRDSSLTSKTRNKSVDTLSTAGSSSCNLESVKVVPIVEKENGTKKKADGFRSVLPVSKDRASVRPHSMRNLSKKKSGHNTETSFVRSGTHDRRKSLPQRSLSTMSSPASSSPSSPARASARQRLMQSVSRALGGKGDKTKPTRTNSFSIQMLSTKKKPTKMAQNRRQRHAGEVATTKARPQRSVSSVATTLASAEKVQERLALRQGLKRSNSVKLKKHPPRSSTASSSVTKKKQDPPARTPIAA